MSSEWVDATLGDYVDFKNGRTSPDRDDCALSAVYGSNGIIGYAEQTNAPDNCLIIGRVGSYCGSVYHSYEKCWVTDNAILGLPKKEGESEFWYYLLIKLDLNSYRSGSGQPLLNQATLKSIPIRVPELAEERAEIGKRLMMFDIKIELNRQTNQTLEQIAQSIFKSWFVDFEPVKAKIAAKQEWAKRMTAKDGGNDEIAGANFVELAAMCAISGKTEEQLKDLIKEADAHGSANVAGGTTPRATLQQLKTTAALFPDALVESELGEIPEGWGNFKMAELVKQIKPGTNYQPKRQESGIPFVNGKHIQNGFLDFTKEIKYITQEEYERVHKNWKPEVNDVLITRIGTLGRVGIVTEYDLPMVLHYNSINIKEGVIKHPFIFFLLKSSYFQYFYHLYKKQAVQEFVTIEAVENIEINLPKDVDTLEGLTKIFEPLFLKLKENHFENISLTQLRDSLLPKLLTGELDLTEAV